MNRYSFKIIFLLIILILTTFISPTFALISTNPFSSITTQLNQIKQILDSMQKTLGIQPINNNETVTNYFQSQTTNTSTTNPTSTKLQCPNLTKSLYLGITSPEVKQLQQFLDKLNLFNYPTYTSYFGPVTQKAVQAFQCKYLNLCQGAPFSNGYGVAGPQTRAKINQLCQNQTFTLTPNNQPLTTRLTQATTSTTTATTTTSNSMFIPFSEWINKLTFNNTFSHNNTYAQDQVFGYVPTEKKRMPSRKRGGSGTTRGSCVFNGQVILHGDSVKAYAQNIVQSGQTCQSEMRVCNNGVLSGSYTYANCTVQGNSSVGNEGYDIIIVAGQSNAVGYGGEYFYDVYQNRSSYRNLEEKIFQLGRYGNNVNKVVPAISISDGIMYDVLEHHGLNMLNRRTMGLAIPFALRYADTYLTGNRKVLIIPAAKGSTSIKDDWDGVINDPNNNGELLDDLISKLDIAINLQSDQGYDNRVVAFIWQQGENDVWITNSGNTYLSDQEYISHLDSMINKLKAKINYIDNVPILIGKFVEAWANEDTKRQQRESAILAYANNHNNISQVDSSALLSRYDSGADSSPVQRIHYSAQSLVDLGDRYFREYIKLAKVLQGKKRACFFDEFYVADGKNAYSYNTLLSLSGCQKVARRCNDGVLEGDSSYKYAKCSTLDSSKQANISLQSNKGYDLPDKIGVTIAPASLYNPHGSLNSLYSDGSVDMRNLGIKTIKLFLPPASSDVSAEFISSKLFSPEFAFIVTAPDIKNILLTSDTEYALLDGNNNGREDISDTRINSSQLRKLYQLYYRLAYDIRKYLNDKNVFIQNHEADWHAEDGTSNRTPTDTGIDNYIDYWNIRYMAIHNANISKIGTSNTYSMCEVVRVLPSANDNSVPSLTRDALPYANCDIVSYSTYEAYTGRVAWGYVDDATNNILDNINRAINYIKNRMNKDALAPEFMDKVAVSEIGVLENWGYPGDYYSDFLDALISITQDNSVPLVVYWSAYSNECKMSDGTVERANACRNDPDSTIIGRWVRKPDGSLSSVISNWFSRSSN